MIWSRAPSRRGFGLILNCRLPECRPGEWPGIAGCQIAFYPEHDPRQVNTTRMAMAVDLKWMQRYIAASLAAPMARQGRIVRGFRACEPRINAMCMEVALDGQGPPGLGLAFVTAKDGYRVQGACGFLPPMLERGLELFDAVLKGFAWDAR